MCTLRNKLRANIQVQNFEEFFETFGVVEGDGMWRAPRGPGADLVASSPPSPKSRRFRAEWVLTKGEGDDIIFSVTFTRCADMQFDIRSIFEIEGESSPSSSASGWRMSSWAGPIPFASRSRWPVGLKTGRGLSRCAITASYLLEARCDRCQADVTEAHRDDFAHTLMLETPHRQLRRRCHRPARCGARPRRTCPCRHPFVGARKDPLQGGLQRSLS